MDRNDDSRRGRQSGEPGTDARSLGGLGAPRGGVTNGREALDLIHRDPPDVVFLDLQMPVLDGFCVVRQLRSDERFRRLPAVAVTASAMLGDRELAIAAGFDSYITKPIHLNEVRKQAEELTSGSYHP